MFQSQIVPVKLTDNEKKQKVDALHKKNSQKHGHISRLHQEPRYVYSKESPHN